MKEANRAQCVFLVGRDPLHPKAGGGDIQAWNWAVWLAERGVGVTYICQSAEGLALEEVMSGVHILRLGAGFALAVRAGLWFLRNRRSIDVVYEDPIGAGRAPYLSPLYSRRPTVAVWHQVSRSLFEELHPAPVAAMLTRIERLVAKCYKRCWFWAPSEEVAVDVVRSFGFAAERVIVVHPTAEPGLEENRRVAPSPPLVTALGVIRRYKAVDHLIRCFASVVSVNPEARLVIAGRRGDEDYEAELRMLVASCGLAEKVEFKFNLSEEEKTELLAASSLLAVPSKLEGYGIVTIEANHLGIPIVASSGVPVAAVTEGENGLRYPFGDFERLGACITRILTDADLAGRLSAGARDHAQRRTLAAQSVYFEKILERAGIDVSGVG